MERRASGAGDVIVNEAPVLLTVDGDLDGVVSTVFTELEGEGEDHLVEAGGTAVVVEVNEGSVGDGDEDGCVVETTEGLDFSIIRLLRDVPGLALVAVLGGDVRMRGAVAPDAEAPLVLVARPLHLAAEEDLHASGLARAEGLAVFRDLELTVNAVEGGAGLFEDLSAGSVATDDGFVGVEGWCRDAWWG